MTHGVSFYRKYAVLTPYVEYIKLYKWRKIRQLLPPSLLLSQYIDTTTVHRILGCWAGLYASKYLALHLDWRAKTGSPFLETFLCSIEHDNTVKR